MDALLLETDEAWRILGIKKSKGWQLLASRELESVRIGRRRLVPVESLHAYVDRLKEHALAEQ